MLFVNIEINLDACGFFLWHRKNTNSRKWKNFAGDDCKCHMITSVFSFLGDKNGIAKEKNETYL